MESIEKRLVEKLIKMTGDIKIISKQTGIPASQLARLNSSHIRHLRHQSLNKLLQYYCSLSNSESLI